MSKAVVQLPIRLIDQGPNVRRRLHVGSPLVASVKRFGVLQPITVARRDGRYEVLYGHRRLAAASLAGDETIAAIVEERPAGLGIRQLVENLDRRNLPHIDVALALRSALDDEPGLSQAALARQLGRHPTWVTNKLALLKLDRSTQDDIRNGTTRADAADNGLWQTWAPSRCWMNPPYGRSTVAWVRKAVVEAARGALVVGLLPARTDTAWFHQHVLEAGAEVRFVRGRVAFDGPSRVVPRAPFPSLVVIWRPPAWIGGRA